MKHGGGSGMVQGCISAVGVGDIVKIDGIMNAAKSRQILIHHAVSGKQLSADWERQHDNDPEHTANAVKSHLERKTADRTLTDGMASQS
ncbi:hypothetical protein LDENG_00026710 [Lucifuga dentata]|nr:hypothetical protein LDENG_00026710 [Lucifuga dentata]